MLFVYYHFSLVIVATITAYCFLQQQQHQLSSQLFIDGYLFLSPRNKLRLERTRIYYYNTAVTKSISKRRVLQEELIVVDVNTIHKRKQQEQQRRSQLYQPHQLYSSPNNNNINNYDTTTDIPLNGEYGRAKIRFSKSSQAGAVVTDPIDKVFGWIASDIGSIIIGCIGLVLLLVGQFLFDTTTTDMNIVSSSTDDITSSEAMVQETRTNLLALFAIGSVLLNGLSKLDVQSALAESVVLDGIVQQNVLFTSNTDNRNDIEWILQSIITSTPAMTAVLLSNSQTTTLDNKESTWKVVAYTGVVPLTLTSNSNNETNQTQYIETINTPILDRFLSSTASSTKTSLIGESYLPTLQALPGRVELTTSILPTNTQAALLVPVFECTDDNNNNETTMTVVVLGSNIARSFTPRDIAWIQAVITRI